MMFTCVEDLHTVLQWRTCSRGQSVAQHWQVKEDVSELTFEEWDPTQHVDTDLNKTLKRSVRSLTGAGRGGHLAQISAGYKS